MNPSHGSAAGVPVPGTPDRRFDAPTLLVEIPADSGAVKRHDLALAQAWLGQAAELFEAAFDAGYVAARFIRHDPERPGRAYHALLRDLNIRALAEETQ